MHRNCNCRIVIYYILAPDLLQKLAEYNPALLQTVSNLVEGWGSGVKIGG